MDDMEMCSIPEETSPEDGLGNFETIGETDSNNVKIVEPAANNGYAYYVTILKLCKFKMNIKQDIPAEFQKLVHNLYFLFILHNIINTGNFLFAILDVQTSISIASTVAYGLIYMIYSYLVCLQCAYKTFSLKSKYYFKAFLASFLIQLVFSFMQTIGAQNAISIGFSSALEKSPDDNPYSNYKMIPELIIASVCGLGALFDVIVIVIIVNMYPKIMNFCKITTPEDEILTPT